LAGAGRWRNRVPAWAWVVMSATMRFVAVATVTTPDKLKIMQSDLWFRITVIIAGVLSAVLVVLLIFMK
jgi:hypothetical protein